jgi:amino acid adenylation domain-containing protein
MVKYCEKSFHQLFEQQVDKTPNNIAVQFDDKVFTYREVDDLANIIAYHILLLSPAAGTRIGLWTERSIEMIAGLIGILKSGCTYVPIDSTFPTDRIKIIIEDCDLQWIIVDDKNQANVESFVSQQMNISTLLQAPSDDIAIKMDYQNKVASVVHDETRLAYILFTSGSTGRPKGVAVAHSSVINLLHSMIATLTLRSSDVCLAATRITFDVSVAEIFMFLSCGAKVVFSEPSKSIDFSYMQSILVDSKATVLISSPYVLKLLTDAGLHNNGLRLLVTTAEHIEYDLRMTLVERFPEVWNLYGPTEATIWATQEKLTAKKVKGGLQRSSIGVPITNMQAYILNERLETVNHNDVGELFLGGAGVAYGYVKRPDLTNDRFIDCPLQAGERLYRTGDLARFLDDGSLEYLGRTDDQIKLRGVRIEPNEIREILSSNSDVLDTVVTLRKDSAENDRLVAFCRVCDPLKSNLAEMLKATLVNKLPSYAVPTRVVCLKDFPQSINGKLDVKQLPNPFEHPYFKSDIEHELSKSKNITLDSRPEEVKSLLHNIWCKFLNIKSISENEDFFFLGGDSLLSVQVGLEIEKNLGKVISIGTMIENPTLAKLFRYLLKNEPKSACIKVFEVRKGDSQLTAIITMPSISGDATCWNDINQNLNPNRAIYSLGITCAVQPLRENSSISEMAENYAKIIIEQFPSNNFILMGYSFGGLLAFEIARKLDERKYSPKAIIIVDAGLEEPPLLYSACAILSFLGNLPSYIADVLHSPKGWKSDIKNKLIRLKTSVFSSENKFFTHEELEAELGIEQSKLDPQTLQHIQINLQAVHDYKAQQYDRKVILLRAKNKMLFKGHYKDWKWGGVTQAEKFTVEYLPGNHQTIMRQHNGQSIAELLEKVSV